MVAISFHPSKRSLFALLIFVLAAGVIAGLGLTGHLHLSTHRKVSQPQQQESQVDANTKKQFTEQPSSPTASSSSSSSSSTSSSDAAALNAATQNPDNVSITATQTDSSTVTVQTKLVGYSDGSCTLTATNGSKTFNQTAQVIYAPDFSTCAGFSVPVSQLGTGTWNVKLDVTSRGNTQSKTTNVEVS